MFRLIGDHWLGLFSARRISSFILYTLVEIYTCGNIKTGFVYFQTEPASVSTSCKWLPVHFLSLVSNMPKKTSMKTTKIISHVFFAWEVSLFRLVCFHPNVRTKASAAATIRPPGQLEKFVPISSCPVGKESLYTARAPLNPQSQFHLLSTRDPQMCSWITRARSPVPRDSKKLSWSRQHRWMSSIIEEINGGWVKFCIEPSILGGSIDSFDIFWPVETAGTTSRAHLSSLQQQGVEPAPVPSLAGMGYGRLWPVPSSPVLGYPPVN